MAQKEPGDRPLYPPERAFVVQFRREDSPQGKVLRGRVEHIRSGRSARFDHPDELLGFVAKTLDRERRPPRSRTASQSAPPSGSNTTETS